MAAWPAWLRLCRVMATETSESVEASVAVLLGLGSGRRALAGSYTECGCDWVRIWDVQLCTMHVQKFSKLNWHCRLYLDGFWMLKRMRSAWMIIGWILNVYLLGSVYSNGEKKSPAKWCYAWTVNSDHKNVPQSFMQNDTWAVNYLRLWWYQNVCLQNGKSKTYMHHWLTECLQSSMQRKKKHE